MRLISKGPEFEQLRQFFLDLYQTALPHDVQVLDCFLNMTASEQNAFTRALAGTNLQLSYVENVALAPIDQADHRVPSTARSPFRQFGQPSSSIRSRPRELKQFFLEENIDLLVQDAYESSRTKTIRSNDVRTYLRHTLETAYYAMSYSTQKAPSVLPPLANQDFLNRLLEAIHERDFRAESRSGTPSRLQAALQRAPRYSGLEPREHQRRADRCLVLGNRCRCGAS